MNNKLKEIYEANPNGWVVYSNSEKKNTGFWYKLDLRIYQIDFSYVVLIAKQHEHIADAVIANVEVEYRIPYEKHNESIEDSFSIDNNFFSRYNPDFQYRLKETKPVNFNGGYIKASQEAYDLLRKNGVESAHYVSRDRQSKWLFVKDNIIYNVYSEDDNVFQTKDYKQFYINNGELSWDEPKEELEAPIEELYEEALCRGEKYLDFSDDLKAYHDHNNSGATQINSMEDELPTVQEGEEDAITNSRTAMCHNGDSDSLEDVMEIEDDNGKVYSFEKPEFECELLKVVGKRIVGYVELLETGFIYPIRWGINGDVELFTSCDKYKYNLNPLKLIYSIKDLNKKFIKASPEAYDKLIKIGVQPFDKYGISIQELKKYPSYYQINDGKFYGIGTYTAEKERDSKNLIELTFLDVIKTWYENPENYPALIIDTDTGCIDIVDFYKEEDDEIWNNQGGYYKPNGCRLATNDEVMSLHWENKQ